MGNLNLGSLMFFLGLVDFVKVSRPTLLLLGILASLGLLKWAGHIQTDPLRTVLTALLVFLVNWAWTLFNEIRDRKLDRVNKPNKPLPSSKVSSLRVYQVFFTLFCFSVGLNLFMIIYYGWVYAIGLLGHLTAFSYNVGRKDLLGNICMATTYAIACFLSLYPHHLLFCLAFFFFTFGHNIIQQFMDLPAEKAVGIVTVPMQFSDLGAWTLTEFLLFFSLVSFSTLYTQTFHMPLLIFITANIGTAFSAYSIIWGKHEKIGKITLKLERALLLVGFFAMLL